MRKNRKIVIDGYIFYSELEGERYRILKDKVSEGKIKKLQPYVEFGLIPFSSTEGNYKYVANFCYLQGGKIVVEDLKGFVTDIFGIKKLLMLKKYGLKVKRIKKSCVRDF